MINQSLKVVLPLVLNQIMALKEQLNYFYFVDIV